MKNIKPDMLSEIPVEMVFEMGRTEKELKEIMSWKKGTQIKLEESVVNQLNIYVHNQLYAHGEVLRNKDGEMSVEITAKVRR
jgi:type III secretion protein Q